MRSLITKAEYLRETEAWMRQQRRAQLLRYAFFALALASLVAILVGWPCADAVCAPAG